MFDFLTGSKKKKKASPKGKKKGEDHLNDPLAGSGMVMGSAADTEYAFDDSFTPALVKKMKDDPKMDLDTAIGQMAGGSLGASADNDGGLHHPTITAFGKKRQARGKHKAQKRAVLMANQKYKHISKLNTPVAEAASFAGVLKARGYNTKQRNNRSASTMVSGWEGMVSSAKPGDSLMAYYAGHGAEEGLCGINDGGPKGDDMVPYSTVSSIVSAATSKGANIRFVMDSCHSGTGAQLVRSQKIGQLAQEGKGMTAKVVSLALSGLQDNRKSLLDHVHAREAALDKADARIRKNQIAAPGSSATPEQLAAWQLKDTKLKEGKARIEKSYDRAAKKLWKKHYEGLAYVAQIAGLKAGAKDITDFRTLGAQLKELDSFSNHLLKWGQDAEAEEAESAS